MGKGCTALAARRLGQRYNYGTDGTINVMLSYPSSADHLQTAQVLYDYALRMANFTQAFMLTALMTRMTQALQINLEYSADLLHRLTDDSPKFAERESRRRLMWSCYATDVLCGSGVEQLTLIKERDLKIQLPCNDMGFLNEEPSITKMLGGGLLPFIPLHLIPTNIDENMGMAAFFIQQVEIRRRVLTYIKRLDEAKPP